MVFVDSNIPMYLIGASHPHKTTARVLVERLTMSGERLVTDAGVFQEILHRYTAIDRKQAIDSAFELLRMIVDEVISVTEADVLRAKAILLSAGGLSARDAVHVATMERNGVHRILSFDADFDRWQGFGRIHQL